MSSAGGVNVLDMYEQPFSLYSDARSAEDPSTSLIRSTHLQPTETARRFFAKANIDRIQLQLQKKIRKHMGVTIDRQSDENLLVVMRYVYMQRGTNYGCDGEVHRLNAHVLDEIVPQVAAGLAQYVGYLRDASTLPVPLARGQATSVKGTKTVELFRGL